MKKIIFATVFLGFSLNVSAKSLGKVNTVAERAIVSYLSTQNVRVLESNSFFSPETPSGNPAFTTYYVSLDVFVKLPKYDNPTLGTCTVLVAEEIANTQNVKAVKGSVKCNF